jgi:two-component system sensor histidine kinase DctS
MTPAALTSAAPAPLRRLGAWAWPLWLALAFSGAVAIWLQWSDAQDLEDAQRTLITDALTLDSRIADTLTAEKQSVDRLAQSLSAQTGAAALLRQAAVAEGLRRMWISVTVLDARNRLQAHVPEQSPSRPPAARPAGADDAGLSTHLSAPLADGGRLVVRIAPTALLRRTVPWWLARRYDVRLVDGFGQLIAASGDALPVAGRLMHRIAVGPDLPDTYLELTSRDRRVPWWRTPPLALMAVFVALSAAASVSMRRQMREVQRAEAQWRTEVAWRRAIEDSLTVGLRGRDTEGRLMHVNRAFCDLVGYPPEQLLGRLPPMPYWPPDAVAESMQRHRRALAGAAPRDGYESRWIRADGTPIDVMIFEAPLVDASGRHVGWMGSIVDITARKRSEERERRQLEAMANQARLTTLGEVASALAHQLNQPLTAIAGYSAGVLRSLERAGFGDAMVLDALRRLGEQAAEAGRIVQRIRAYLTRRAPQRERCDLGKVARDAVALLKRDLERESLQVELAIDDDLPPVSADAVLIEQVILNLVRNAADELAAAGTPAPRIRLSARRAGERFVRIDVDDNGPGLRGRGIEQLAAPFYSTKPDGMGMGLAICRSIVEAHYGGMQADAGALGGARLSFTLPVEQTVAATP